MGRSTEQTKEVPTPEVTTYAIDHDRCQHCGRSSCGQRCNQGVATGFERAMARARSLEVGEDANRPLIAPCADKCPLFLCIQGYTAHIAAGRYADALELIMSGLPLADSVCRVCHRPCEAACVLGKQPVAINDLKRFVMDWAERQEDFPYQPQPPARNGLSVAVVGAGPAGLAAAHELAMRGYEVRLIDANDEPGGMLATGIPPYRLPRQALRRDIDRILGLGVAFEGGKSLGADLHLAQLLDDHDAVMLAIGAGSETPLDLGTKGPAVIQGLSYLQGDTQADRVVVIGGGNTAVDTARTAVRRGATKVIVACLEDRNEMPAIGSEITAAENEAVQIHTGLRAIGMVRTGIEMVSVAARVAGNTDPDNYEAIAGTEFTLEADLVVVAIGQRPDIAVLQRSDVALASPTGFQIDDQTGGTVHERVFAAGDVADSGGTVTGAIAAGLRAAWGIDRSLRGPAKADERVPPPRVSSAAPVGRPGITRLDPKDRIIATELEPADRARDFREAVGAFTEEQAQAEASRCMICGLCGNCNACLDLFGCPAFLVEGGRIEIDPILCVACGVCAQFCPNDAIYPVQLTAAL